MASSLNKRAIMDLPDDILIIILENLNVGDLKSISLVNSRFYELMTTTPSVYKKFKLNVDSKYNATIIEALMESNRHYENLAIPCSKHDYDEPCKSSQIIDLMKKVGGRVKNMEFIHIDDHRCPKPILELLATMPNIESLMIFPQYIPSECVKRLRRSTIFKFSQLKEVHVPFAMFLPILKHVNTLEKLILLKRHECVLDHSNCMEFIEVLRNNQSTLMSLKLNTSHVLFEHDIQVLFFNLFHCQII